MKKKSAYRITVERIFSDEGKTLDEIYLDYMAEKIAELVKDMQKEIEPIKNTV